MDDKGSDTHAARPKELAAMKAQLARLKAGPPALQPKSAMVSLRNQIRDLQRVVDDEAMILAAASFSPISGEWVTVDAPESSEAQGTAEAGHPELPWAGRRIPVWGAPAAMPPPCGVRDCPGEFLSIGANAFLAGVGTHGKSEK